MTLKLAGTSVVKSRPSVPYGANLFVFSVVCMKEVILFVKSLFVHEVTQAGFMTLSK